MDARIIKWIVRSPTRAIAERIAALEAELEDIKNRLMKAACAEYEDTCKGYTERVCDEVEALLKEWDMARRSTGDIIPP